MEHSDYIVHFIIITTIFLLLHDKKINIFF